MAFKFAFTEKLFPVVVESEFVEVLVVSFFVPAYDIVARFSIDNSICIRLHIKQASPGTKATITPLALYLVPSLPISKFVSF
ncbi:MAG TPA: hypothetical protein VIJ75_07095 [Hanamia sp.]